LRGLAGQAQHAFNPVGGVFPLLAGECFAFVAVSYLNMEERLFAFGGPGHDFHIAESVLDVSRFEAAKLPGFGVFSVLGFAPCSRRASPRCCVCSL